ncbi:hypothetical protein [Kutzneria buriramensis]|uniref:Ribosomally synthesized peptide with SipW-like signal peptide n=1 Tax=Kutzneria buriramensis TaxID=1045776 RepID=A0A3E0H7U3_9PSEU|nr:hypothetical protein [Kutzneria buriramensis]REH39368.1 hypothetical protein BCF44_113223 [Kutzneria buriramensis]
MRSASRRNVILVASCALAGGLIAGGTVAVATAAGGQQSANPGHQPFVISGDLAGKLAPGSPPLPLNLTLRNTNNQAIAISVLTVAVTGSSAGTACDASNFSTTQYAGSYPLTIGANQTASLTQLGVAATALPRIGMIDRPVNQDRCRNVTVSLAYTGTGQGQGS